MGAAESIPDCDAGSMSRSRDDGCRREPLSPSSSTRSFRMPLNEESDASPSRRAGLKQGRPACTTSSTILTSESAPFSPSTSCERGDKPNRDDDDDCWGGSVLKNIVSLISPHKEGPVLSSSQSYEVMNHAGQQPASIADNGDHAAANDDDNAAANDGDHAASKSCIDDTPSQPCHYQHQVVTTSLASDKSMQSWESPSDIQDFPLRSWSSMPCKRLQFNDQEYYHNDHNQSHLPLEQHHYNARRQRCRGVSGSLQHLLLEAAKYEEESDFDAAISTLEELLRLSQTMDSTFECDQFRAATLHKLGILQWKRGRYFFGEHALSDCLHLYQCLLHSGDPALHEPDVFYDLLLDSASSYLSLGRVNLSKGEVDAAMHCYNECVRHVLAIPRSRSSFSTLTPSRIFAQACVGAGRVLASQGKMKASLKRYKRALKIQLGQPSGSFAIEQEDMSDLSFEGATVPLNDVAETLSHLGRLYEQWNDLSRAMECHAKALDVYRFVLEPEAVDIGCAAANLGHVYLRLGHFAEAEDAFKTAHEVFSLRLGKDHRNTADALLSLGQLYASQGRHKKALNTYKRVLRPEPAVSGQLLAATLCFIAQSHEATCKMDKALKYYGKAVNLMSPKTSLCLDRARILHHMAKIAVQVDWDGRYLPLDQTMSWLEEAAESYFANQEHVCDHELSHLEEFIEDTRTRMKRKTIY
ncbi:hypothetical protein ACHAWF_008871 [Thalassiosira exigua]